VEVVVQGGGTATSAAVDAAWWRRLARLSDLEKRRALQIICADLEPEPENGGEADDEMRTPPFSSLS